MTLKNKDILQTRRYARRDGNFRIISVPSRIWKTLDWLIDEYQYPVDELIEDIEEIYGEVDFDKEFAEGITIAFEAQVMARDGLANDNFSTGVE